VLECLQKALRIATSSIDELTSVQLYCDALDQYLYYFERGVEAVRHFSLLTFTLLSRSSTSLPSIDLCETHQLPRRTHHFKPRFPSPVFCPTPSLCSIRTTPTLDLGCDFRSDRRAQHIRSCTPTFQEFSPVHSREETRQR